MRWVWIIAALLLAVAAVSVWLAFQNPHFVLGLATAAVGAAVKAAIPTVTKRMPPELEKAWRDCQRRGGKWNHQKKRCE